MKMLGVYPVLIPLRPRPQSHKEENDEEERKKKKKRIFGTIWKVNTESEFLRLAEYETSAYTTCPCTVYLSSNSSSSSSSGRDWEEEGSII